MKCRAIDCAASCYCCCTMSSQLPHVTNKPRTWSRSVPSVMYGFCGRNITCGAWQEWRGTLFFNYKHPFPHYKHWPWLRELPHLRLSHAQHHPATPAAPQPTGKSHTFIISPCVRSPTCMLAPLHPTCGSGLRSTTRPPPQLDTPQAKVTNLSSPHVSSPQHACSHTHTHTQAHTQHTHLHLTCGSGTRSTTRPPPRLHSPAMARRMEVLPAPEGPIISSGLPRAT